MIVELHLHLAALGCFRMRCLRTLSRVISWAGRYSRMVPPRRLQAIMSVAGRGTSIRTMPVRCMCPCAYVHTCVYANMKRCYYAQIARTTTNIYYKIPPLHGMAPRPQRPAKPHPNPTLNSKTTQAGSGGSYTLGMTLGEGLQRVRLIMTVYLRMVYMYIYMCAPRSASVA